MKTLQILLLILLKRATESTVASSRCQHRSLQRYTAKEKCSDTKLYHCLVDGNKRDNSVELCETPKQYRQGLQVIYRGNIDAETCEDTRFSPQPIWSNEGNVCPYLKHSCHEEGQLIANNGTNDKDRSCRCDYTKGYAFISTPENLCSCFPAQEDCSCYVKQCENDDDILSQDYNCTGKYKEDRNENFICPSISNTRLEEVETIPKLYNVIDISGVGVTNSKLLISTVVIVLAMLGLACFCVYYRKSCYVVRSTKTNVQSKKSEDKNLTDDEEKVDEHSDQNKKSEEENLTVDDEKVDEHSETAVKVLYHQEKDMYVVEYYHKVKQLEEAKDLINNTKVRMIVLRGPPGAGKSQTANRICLDLEKKFSVIAKLTATDASTLLDTLKELAKDLALDIMPGESTSENYMKLIEPLVLSLKKFFNHESRCDLKYLLLVDDANVSDGQLFDIIDMLIAHLLKVKKLKLLFTSKNPTFAKRYLNCREVKFEGMDEAEYLSFFGKDKFDKDITNLVKEIGSFPFTLVCARTFINAEPSITINKYIELFNNEKVQKLQLGGISRFESLFVSHRIPLNQIKENLGENFWSVIMLFPYLDYKAVSPEIIEACCHHSCIENPMNYLDIILEFRKYSLCHNHKADRQLRSLNNQNENKDFTLSFHAETMNALEMIDTDDVNYSVMKGKRLCFLFKIFCYEMDIDTRVDKTLERNIMFVNHARKVLKLTDNLCHSEEIDIYVCYLNFLVGKTLLFQGPDLKMAHKYLMKSRHLCLSLVRQLSTLSNDRCTYINPGAIDIEDEQFLVEAKQMFESLSKKSVSTDLVTDFVLSKRRNERDVYILRKESKDKNIACYLTKENYEKLISCKLAMAPHLMVNNFLCELMLHILFDNGRALNDLNHLVKGNEKLELARNFEYKACKQYKDLMKARGDFRDYPCLRYLAVERREILYNMFKHQDFTKSDLDYRIEEINKSMTEKAHHYFQFGVIKTSPKEYEHHECMCYRNILICHKHKCRMPREDGEEGVFAKGKSFLQKYCEKLDDMENDKALFKWVEMPSFYIQCGKFLQLSGDNRDLQKAINHFDKTVTLEEERRVNWTPLMWEAYRGKTECLLKLRKKDEALRIKEMLTEKLAGTDKDNLLDQLNKILEEDSFKEKPKR